MGGGRRLTAGRRSRSPGRSVAISPRLRAIAGRCAAPRPGLAAAIRPAFWSAPSRWTADTARPACPSGSTPVRNGRECSSTRPSRRRGHPRRARLARRARAADADHAKGPARRAPVLLRSALRRTAAAGARRLLTRRGLPRLLVRLGNHLRARQPVPRPAFRRPDRRPGPLPPTGHRLARHDLGRAGKGRYRLVASARPLGLAHSGRSRLRRVAPRGDPARNTRRGDPARRAVRGGSLGRIGLPR